MVITLQTWGFHFRSMILCHDDTLPVPRNLKSRGFTHYLQHFHFSVDVSHDIIESYNNDLRSKCWWNDASSIFCF